jgi:hypothetical protein
MPIDNSADSNNTYEIPSNTSSSRPAYAGIQSNFVDLETRKEHYFQAIVNQIAYFEIMSNELAGGYYDYGFSSFDAFKDEFRSYVLEGNNLKACKHLLTDRDKYIRNVFPYMYRDVPEAELKTKLANLLLSKFESGMHPPVPATPPVSK